MREATEHPHHQARNAFVDVAGVRQPAPAPRLSRTPAKVQAPPPLLGEHSAEQLAALGLSGEEIKRLAALGAETARDRQRVRRGAATAPCGRIANGPPPGAGGGFSARSS